MIKFNNRPDTAMNYDLPFLAKITNVSTGASGGYFEGLNVYSWVEQQYAYDSSLALEEVDAQSPRMGEYDPDTDDGAQVAIEPNNRQIEPGTYVYLKVKGFVGDILVYEVVDFTQTRFVKVTGSTTTDGWYPAILQQWDTDSQSWEEAERWDIDTQEFTMSSVWVRGANDESLNINTRYGAQYVGLFENVQSYVTVGTSGGETESSSAQSLEVIVPPLMCGEGGLVYNTKFIVGNFTLSETSQ